MRLTGRPDWVCLGLAIFSAGLTVMVAFIFDPFVVVLGMLASLINAVAFIRSLWPAGRRESCD